MMRPAQTINYKFCSSIFPVFLFPIYSRQAFNSSHHRRAGGPAADCVFTAFMHNPFGMDGWDKEKKKGEKKWFEFHKHIYLFSLLFGQKT